MNDRPRLEPMSAHSFKSPRPRWWKWTRRLLIASVVLFGVFVVALFGGRAYFRSTGVRGLEAEKARLDAVDPGWRWDDIATARDKTAPPDAENSAVIVREVRALMPDEWKEWVARPDQPKDEKPAPLNRLIPLADLTRDQHLMDATQSARDRGQVLRNYPRGYHMVTVGDLPFLESLAETQDARHVAHLMKVDALLATQRGDPVRAVRAARAILNVGRSIGDEPTLVSSLVRFACGLIAAESTIRVLALTNAKDALPELILLQAELLAEASEPILRNGLRGERAIMSRFYDGVISGRISADQMARMADMQPSAEHRIVRYFLNAFLPEDQRRYLAILSEVIESSKKPYAEQVTTIKRIEEELRANRDIRYTWHVLMQLPMIKGTEASHRHRAVLLATVTLIACERFRLARGKWPGSLAEIPKDILPAIPTDPFTGASLLFSRLPDGIAVYSLPPKDMPGLDQNRLTNPLGGAELGYPLYDPAQRGLPPLPKPQAEVPDPIEP